MLPYQNLSLEDMQGEEWRDIPGWEGYFKVSNFGRIKTVPREVVPERGRIHYVTEHIRKQVGGGKGLRYLNIGVNKDGREYRIRTHRAVAMAFVPNPENKPCIDHINTDTYDNRAENLRWTNRSGNMLNPVSQMRQSLSHKGKLIESTLKPVVRISSDGSIKKYSHINGATPEGFSAPMISMCCSGKRKTHKGYRWMYLSDYESQVSMSKNS